MASNVEKMEVDAKSVSAIKQEQEDELHHNVLATQNLVIKEEEDRPNPVVAEEKKVQCKEDEEKMDINVKITFSNGTAEEDPVSFYLEETSQGLMKLSVDGIEDNSDETLTLCPEEVRSYLEEKVKEYYSDPKVNPLLEMMIRSQELQVDIAENNAEFNKLNKLYEIMNRNQEKFLRHMGVFEKIATNSVGISVDLPVLPDSVPSRTSMPNNIQESRRIAQNATPALTTAAPAPAPPLTVTSSIPVQNNPGTKEPPKVAEFKMNTTAKPPNSSILCIDLTDELDPPSARNVNGVTPNAHSSSVLKHPAPLPPRPFVANESKGLPILPNKPSLKVQSEERGIVLQWDMPYSISPNSAAAKYYPKICAFDIFGYQEQANAPITTLLWKKIGSVKAMTLPMACTLTQFLEGNKYHFAVRAMDAHNRYGCFSDPVSMIYSTLKKT